MCFIVDVMALPPRLAPCALPVLVALALAPGTALAQNSDVSRGSRVGVGATLGYPGIGLSVNFFFNERWSAQLGVGWGYRAEDRYVGARANLLYWFPSIAEAGWGELVWYAGVGAYTGFPTGPYVSERGTVRSSGVFFIGAEAVVGIGPRFKAVPLDVMVELVPRLHLADDLGAVVTLGLGANVHVRYYF